MLTLNCVLTTPASVSPNFPIKIEKKTFLINVNVSEKNNNNLRNKLYVIPYIISEFTVGMHRWFNIRKYISTVNQIIIYFLK